MRRTGNPSNPRECRGCGGVGSLHARERAVPAGIPIKRRGRSIKPSTLQRQTATREQVTATAGEVARPLRSKNGVNRCDESRGGRGVD